MDGLSCKSCFSTGLVNAYIAVRCNISYCKSCGVEKYRVGSKIRGIGNFGLDISMFRCNIKKAW